MPTHYTGQAAASRQAPGADGAKKPKLTPFPEKKKEKPKAAPRRSSKSSFTKKLLKRMGVGM